MVSNIDEAFIMYEKRYNLSKIAVESGIYDEDFNTLDSKNKFLLLAYKLRESKKLNLASFFFGKLFELTSNLEALINKIDCLIELNEYDEANRLNNLALELYLEDPSINTLEVEKKLNYQKGLIAFFTDKLNYAQWICEESIVRYMSVEFFCLLCAVFISFSDYENAKKIYNKYGTKFSTNFEFLFEVFLLLENTDNVKKAIDFISMLPNINEKQIDELINSISIHYNLFSKDKDNFKKCFEKIFIDENI